MIQILALIAGFALGWRKAARAGGNRMDKLQYGAAHGIFFFLVALFLVIVADRVGIF